MKEGHDEFTDRFVDGFAVTQDRVVCLCDGTPMAVLSENGDDVILVERRGGQADKQGTMTVETECERGKHRAFDAVRGPRLQDHTRAHARVTAGLVV